MAAVYTCLTTRVLRVDYGCSVYLSKDSVLQVDYGCRVYLSNDTCVADCRPRKVRRVRQGVHRGPPASERAGQPGTATPARSRRQGAQGHR